MKHNDLQKTGKSAVFFILLAVLWLAQFAGLTAAAQAAAPGTFGAPAVPAGYALSAEDRKAVLLLNADRRNAGLEPLKVNLKLSKLAADFAKDMNARKFFSHVDPDGNDPFDRMAANDIDFPNAGENIAFCPDVETAHKMLMKSPSHRENILNPKFTQIGIGARPNSRGGVYLVQEFIGP